MKTANENLRMKYFIFKNEIRPQLRFNKSTNKFKFKNLNKETTFNDFFNPEAEYVTRLNFFSPKKIKDGKKTLFNLTTETNFSKFFAKTKQNFKNTETSIKDKNNNEDENKTKNDENDKYNIDNIKEYKLEKERRHLEIKIKKIKKLLESLNKDLSKILSEIESVKSDIEVIQNIETSSIIEKNLKRAFIFSSNYKHEFKEKLPLINKQNKNELDTMIFKHKRKLFKNCKMSKEKLKNLTHLHKEILQKIEACEYDLKEFRQEKNSIKDELLLHYHKLLLEGKETRKDGLSWIIRAIWDLKSNVLLSYLPKFLDEKSIEFLFLYAMRKNQMNLIEEKIKELIIKIKESEDKYNSKSQKQKKIKKILTSPIIDNNTNFIKNRKENFSFNKEKIKNQLIIEENKNITEKIMNTNKRLKSFTFNNNSCPNINNDSTKNNNVKNDTNNLNLSPNSKKNMYDYNTEKISVIENFSECRNINYFLGTGENNINFNDTFKTSLYNNDTNNSSNSENFFLKKQKKNHFQKEMTAEEIYSKIKLIFINKKILTTDEHFCVYNEKDKIKLKDFENIYNEKNDINKETMKLLEEKKNVETLFKNLKNDMENMKRNELDRISKCFFKENYAEKYKVSQKEVISAIVGEDEARIELGKQIKECNEYFIALKKLRNGV